MTNKEILTRAIEKAIGGGWKPFNNEWTVTPSAIWYKFPTGKNGEITNNPVSIEAIIFNHDFAKALWGEDIRIVGETPGAMTDEERPLAWQWYLQRMVIAEDPIKYLGDNI